MNSQFQVKTEASTDAFVRGGMLQRKCDCGNHTMSGTCEECAKKSSLQRKASSVLETPAVPSIVHEVLRASGEQLNAATRASFEPQFGQDFTKVRVHSDAKAAQSARAVNALAYTVGRDIVFGEAQYAPWSTRGQRLIAHELTHVVQQGNAKWSGGALTVGTSDTPQEREADSAKRGEILSPAPSTSASFGTLQRDETGFGGLFLRANEDGRIEILYATPDLPITGSVGGGFRCEHGRCQPVGGQNPSDATNRTYTIQEALDLLHGGGASPTGPGGPTGRQCPTDRQIPFLTGTCCPSGTTWDGSSCAPWSVPLCLPTQMTPSGRCCPSGESWDFLARRCAPPTPVGPRLELPDLTLPTRPRFTFGTIESSTFSHFDSDGSAVPSRHQAALDHLASLLNIYRDVEVHIEGHTDTTASEEHNERLSLNRAEAVRLELLSRTVVNPARLQVEGLGERELRVRPERNDEDRAMNRRVEVWFHIPPSPPLGSEFRLRLPSLSPP